LLAQLSFQPKSQNLNRKKILKIRKSKSIIKFGKIWTSKIRENTVEKIAALFLEQLGQL